MNPETLYQRLGQLIAEFPNLDDFTKWNTPVARLWLGRAAALVDAANNGEDRIFNNAVNHLGNTYLIHRMNVQTITAILYRCLARAEILSSNSREPSFIPVGEPYSALNAISKVFGGAKTSVFLIDPYADANLLNDYAVLIPESVPLLLLTDEKLFKPSLKPAARTWIAQYGPSRPLEVRLAPAKTLHDRVIFVDKDEVWTIGQSFNALGTRSPTALVRVNAETAALKRTAYNSLWSSSAAMP